MQFARRYGPHFPSTVLPWATAGLTQWASLSENINTVRILDADTGGLRWLGQNSRQAKLYRQLGDVQIRMRLKVSGDRPEIRQSYLPALFPHIVKPLIDEGAVCNFPLIID
jgi:Replication factor RFC1 C terminal domain